MSHWVYSAIIVAIASAFLGLTVSALVIRRIYHGSRPRPAIALLLFSLLGLSLAQMIEQTRVLAFRASYDGYVDQGVFFDLYNATWNVASSKVIMAMSLSAAAALKLGLYCDREDEEIVAWAFLTAGGTFFVWVALSMVFDYLI